MRQRLFIVCDVRLLREGMERGLRRRGTLEVAGSAETGQDALERIRMVEVDLVLLALSDRTSTDVVESIALEMPDVKIVAFGVEDNPEAVVDLVEAGAAGYVPPDASLDDLIEALESVARGEARCSPRVAGFLFRRVSALAGRKPHDQPLDELTDRERQILGLIEQGCSNKEIARTLGVKIPTVKNHVHNILDKLGVARRGAAAAIARNSSSRV